MESNLLDSLLDLEEEFYKEGYDLGVSDGSATGYAEGTVFGVEKGYEKLVEMGRLYGKALVWAQRLADSKNSQKPHQSNGLGPQSASQNGEVALKPLVCSGMSPLPPSSRLTKNLSTLLELADPATLSLENTEEAVNDIDERLKGASVKAKLIQRALGEHEDNSDIHPDAKEVQTSGDGTGSIEDISSLNIRGH